ncbi:hypothetical protein [Leptospira mayottensis]|uniref:Uncharacterized protein n=2 Tax=Leptospira mayottensis TaxID=1137606 RepID=A0AA87MQK2_9LEPT|nr:hypothetical protein [Leptospira mayottensis]AXR62690.1 hypothetical protein DQM68_18600 [Leptospira mayottensis]AXR66415.1 hypothetical protein DQM28_19625 [Leptospira mayottensis]AZQ04073.1 hypothetical protein LEP1GSC190_18675 [Leptospira mayottensis 200901116]EKS00030.1 hypothetical protein LEP1GSC125_3572 [Leptospira mayottensis 200901122]TGN11241.1 hypothetical protein EHR03_06880 [Leptospira mayottensis]
MRIIGVINIQSSLFVSSLSAIGLGILLSVVQVKTPEHFQKTEFLPFEEKNDSFKSSPTSTGKREKEIQEFRILGAKRSNLLNELEKDLELTGAKDFGFAGIGNTWTLFPSRNNLKGNQSDLLFNNLNADWMGARFFDGKQNKIQIMTSVLPFLPFSELAPSMQGRKADPIGNMDRIGVNQAKLDSFELSYTILPGVEAILKTGNSLPYTADQKDQGYSMAGFSFKPNEYLSTKIISGSSFGNSSLTTNRLPYSANAQLTNIDPNVGTNPILRNQALGNTGGRVIEWQASIQPVKRLLFQTSVLNKEKEKGLYNPEAARFSMFIDFSKIILNVRYSYSADPTAKNNGFYITPESDATTLGFTMLLDPAGRYSLFFGNNYYNLLSSRPSGINTQVDEPLRSFSASFRGKTSFQSAIFFMNFRNNLSKGVIYTDVGPLRLPAFSQYYTEYFTSLGMELSF